MIFYLTLYGDQLKSLLVKNDWENSKGSFKVNYARCYRALLKVFKLDKLVDYMELPNEADRKIQGLEDKIKILVDNSHPPIDDLTKRLKKLEEMASKVKKIRSL